MTSPRRFIRWGRSPSRWSLWHSGWTTRWSRTWLQIWLLAGRIRTHLPKRWPNECFSGKGVLYRWRLSDRRSCCHPTENRSPVGWTTAMGLPGSLLPSEKASSGNFRTVMINDNAMYIYQSDKYRNICIVILVLRDPASLTNLHKLLL